MHVDYILARFLPLKWNLTDVGWIFMRVSQRNLCPGGIASKRITNMQHITRLLGRKNEWKQVISDGYNKYFSITLTSWANPGSQSGYNIEHSENW